MNNSKLMTGILFTVIAVILIALGLWIFISLDTDAVSASTRGGALFRSFLLFQNEEGLQAGMLFLLNAETGRAALYEVPGNLGVFISSSSSRVDSLDTMFSEEDLDPYLDELKRILDTDTVFYLSLSSQEAFSAVVDLLGGFRTVLDVVENYVDGENLISFLDEGVLQYGTGAQLLLEKFSIEQELLSHRELQRELYSHFTSNLDFRSFRTLIALLSNVQPNSVYYRMVEGSQREVIAEGEKKMLLFPYFDGEWVQKTVQQLEEALLHEQEVLPAIITLEILNGTDLVGLAGRTRDLYRRFGFDILAVGNAPESDAEYTTIFNHTESIETAQKVADVIGAERIVNDVSEQVDVTIVLGKDFDGRYVRPTQ